MIRQGKTPVTGVSQGVHLEGCRSQEPCTTAEHAERNAIAWAARHGIKLEDSRLFVTHMPCLPCSMSIINAGVERVYYFHPYRDDSGVKLLTRAGVGVS
jgi:dCMP deaminase